MGCATGFFLEAALQAGFDVSGIELSPVAIGMAAAAVRPRIVQGDVNTMIARGDERFDVVTAFDIIEHTFDPAAFLADIRAILGDGGVLAMSTPDTGHWLRPLMGAAWPMLQPDQHTFLFSRAAMRDLLVVQGYEPLVVERTVKVLTLDYLFGQLGQTNPVLSRWLNRLKGLIPGAVRHRDMPINIGEMFVCARRR